MDGKEAAEYLRAIADRIERNPPEEFAGAFLVFPPGDTPGMDNVTFSRAPNEAVFWANTKAQIEMAVDAFKQAEGPGALPGSRQGGFRTR